MAEKSLKASWIVLTVVACVILIIGFTLIFLSEQVFLSPGFQSGVGEEWYSFKAANENPALFFVGVYRQLGIFILILGFYGLAVILRPYRRAEKWAWWLSLGGHTAGWAAAIVMGILAKLMPHTIIYAVLLVAAYVALAIGAKAILKKAST